MAENKLIVEELPPPRRKITPFPNLDSLLATVEILSYLDFIDGVEELCQIMSPRTQAYFKS